MRGLTWCNREQLCMIYVCVCAWTSAFYCMVYAAPVPWGAMVQVTLRRHIVQAPLGSNL